MAKETFDYQELLHTPIFKMDGMELEYLIKRAINGNAEPVAQQQKDTETHFVYGIKGIAQIFGCSPATARFPSKARLPVAFRIKRSGIINKAISQVGRKITTDADMALDLARRSNLKFV